MTYLDKVWRALLMVLAACFAAFLLFYSVAWFVFQWRNPKANSASFIREFYHVVKFDKLDDYQLSSQAR